jgi:hypothetical protein
LLTYLRPWTFNKKHANADADARGKCHILDLP